MRQMAETYRRRASTTVLPWLKNRSWAWFPGDKKPSKYSWKWHAVERWGAEAQWIVGQGKHAVVSRCGPLRVSLWYFRSDAKGRMKALGRSG